MDLNDARHFAARVELDTHPTTIARYASLSREEAVGAALATLGKPRVTQPPAWVSDRRTRKELLGELGDKRKVQMLQRQRVQELKVWWFGEMIATDAPLAERLTLGWHNHFTTGARKVRFPRLLFRQNETLRRGAGGDFRELTAAMCRDPAMLLYLDNHRNLVDRPNENFARELMELFTMGEGTYTDQDVKELARAFTGWTIDRKKGTHRFAKRRHDAGEKTFLGKTGAFGAEDALAIIFEQRATAEHIVEKVWDDFVATPVDPKSRKRLADDFSKDWAVASLLRSVLESRQFWAEENRGTRIKSPVELIVGTVRTLGMQMDDRAVMARVSRQLGQDLFDPPNVKGWDGGDAWIGSNTLLRRMQVMNLVASAKSAAREPQGWLGDVWKDDDLAMRIQRVLLAVPAVQESEPAANVGHFLRQILLDPSYQVT